MSCESRLKEMTLREASENDISMMARHHRKMFEEIWELKGEHLGSAKAIKIQDAYKEKLETELKTETCKAWVIEDAGKIIASGAITFVSFVPNPSDLSSRVVYLHSIYTEKSHRDKGCAQRIVHDIIGRCKSLGIKRVILNASEAGRPIYEKIGFRPSTNTMMLLIE